MDISKLETNTQCIERLEREKAELLVALEEICKSSFSGLLCFEIACKAIQNAEKGEIRCQQK